MIVSTVGAHGSIARHLSKLLTERGHTVRGLVRKQEQFDDIRSDGAEPVWCDLESASAADLDDALQGSSTSIATAVAELT